MDHIISNETGGEGNMGWVMAACSCGWKGSRRYAYDDRQYTDMYEDQRYHARQVRKDDARPSPTLPQQAEGEHG